MAQSEYLKEYKKTHPDKVADWNKKYQTSHKEELAMRRQVKIRQAQHAKLVSLITEYVEGATLVELEDKYIVRLRPQKGMECDECRATFKPTPDFRCPYCHHKVGD